MLKRKKVTRTILAFIAITLFSIGPFVSFVNAESFSGNTFVYYHYSNNIQGTASGYREDTADYYIYNDPTNKKYKSVVTINFEGTVTGTFNLGLPVQYNSSDVVVTENCVVDSVTASTGSTIWYFNVNGVDSCTVEYYTITTSRGLSSFSGTWTHSTDLDDINTTLGQIKGYIDGVESSLNTISSRLQTINTTISLGNSILQKIQNYVKVSSFPTWQQSVLLWALCYGDLNYDSIKPSFTYDSSLNNSAYEASKRLCVAPKSTYSLYIYTIGQLGATSWKVYMRGSDPAVVSKRTYSYTPPASQYYFYRFDFTNNSTSHVYFEVEFQSSVTMYPIFFGNINNVPDDVHYLFGDDLNNTYTRLLMEISQGVSSLQSDQTTIDNSTTVTNNFNTEITKINNVELNVLSGFDNKLNTVNTAINNSGILTDNINSVPKQWAEFYLTKVFDNLVVIKYPVYIILIGFVLLCLLG